MNGAASEPTTAPLDTEDRIQPSLSTSIMGPSSSSVDLTVDVGRIKVALNACAPCAQAFEIRPGRIVNAEHLIDVEFQGRELLLESVPARTFEPPEVARRQTAFQGDAVAPAGSDD
jgi:hypothetical protein